jgi:hypothetical protein
LFYNQTNFDAGNFTIATFRGNSQVFNALFPQTYGEIWRFIDSLTFANTGTSSKTW